MSTNLHYWCVTHDPNIRSDDEVGRNLSDLPAIRADLNNVEKIVETIEQLPDGVWDLDFSDQHKRRRWIFLWNHRNCEIEIYDEYNQYYPLYEGPAEKPIERDTVLGKVQRVEQNEDGIKVVFGNLTPEGQRIFQRMMQ